MNTKKISLSLFLCLIAMSGSPGAWAQGTGASPTPSPKETVKVTAAQRQKMAELHDKMAACLRSDRKLEECHQEMMKACKGMGKDGCPFMGGMKGKGMGGHHHHDHPGHEDHDE